MPFPWCVAWACACGPDMQVGAEALHDAWAYMLGELGNAAIEVAVCTPADLRCTFPVRPVLHQAFGVSGMTLCTACVHHVSAGLPSARVGSADVAAASPAVDRATGTHSPRSALVGLGPPCPRFADTR